MIPAWDYSQVLRDLKRAFEYRYEKNGFGGVRMVGLLFAPPEARLARDDIIPGLQYFHHRSGDNIDFFCAGYRRYGPDPEPGEKLSPTTTRRGSSTYACPINFADKFNNYPVGATRLC